MLTYWGNGEENGSYLLIGLYRVYIADMLGEWKRQWKLQHYHRAARARPVNLMSLRFRD